MVPGIPWARQNEGVGPSPCPCWGYAGERNYLMWGTKNLVRPEGALADTSALAEDRRVPPLPWRGLLSGSSILLTTEAGEKPLHSRKSVAMGGARLEGDLRQLSGPSYG